MDLCACRTQATFSEDGDTRILTLDPVDIEFEKFTIGVQSIFRLPEGTGEIEIIRKVVSSTDPNAEVGIDEYITTCYGTTEYPEDLTGVQLTLMGGPEPNPSTTPTKMPRGGSRGHRVGRGGCAPGRHEAVDAIRRGRRGRHNQHGRLFPRGNGFLADVYDRHQEERPG